MEPVVELWNGLCRVRSLRFVAQSAGVTGWQGIGMGSVIVDASTDSALTFTESGSWQPATGRSLRFSNVFRWSRINADLIRLEHLRFGADHPVYLFDLAPKRSGEWTSVRPHLCEEDCYAAELRLQESGLWLRWTVTGPKKHECIEYSYR